MNNELVAIPVFQERISPLLDEARRFAIYEICDAAITQKIVLNINLNTDAMRICKLKEMGITVLICGAVSSRLSRFIVNKDVRHFPWVDGTPDDVIDLFLKGGLTECFAGLKRCEGGNKKKCCAICDNNKEKGGTDENSNIS